MVPDEMTPENSAADENETLVTVYEASNPVEIMFIKSALDEAEMITRLGGALAFAPAREQFQGRLRGAGQAS